MKTKWLVRILIVSTTVLALTIGAFCLANLRDEVIRPEVLAILEMQTPINDEATRGRDYLLGLAVPKSEKPEDYGRKLSEQVRFIPESQILECVLGELEPCPARAKVTDLDSQLLHPCELGTWCIRETYLPSAVPLEKIIQEKAHYLARFRHLVQLGQFAGDSNPILFGGAGFSLLKITMLQLSDWNFRLFKDPSSSGQVVAEINAFNSMIMRSLEHGHSLIDTQIMLLTVASTRKFLRAAATEVPQIKKFAVVSFPDVSFENIARRALNRELLGMSVLTASPKVWQGFMGIADGGDASHRTRGPVESAVDWFARIGFLKNAFLNLIYEDYQRSLATASVATNSPDDDGKTASPIGFNPRNISGRLIQVMAGKAIAPNLYNMKKKIEEIHQPFSFDTAI